MKHTHTTVDQLIIQYLGSGVFQLIILWPCCGPVPLSSSQLETSVWSQMRRACAWRVVVCCGGWPAGWEQWHDTFVAVMEREMGGGGWLWQNTLMYRWISIRSAYIWRILNICLQAARPLHHLRPSHQNLILVPRMYISPSHLICTGGSWGTIETIALIAIINSILKNSKITGRTQIFYS